MSFSTSSPKVETCSFNRSLSDHDEFLAVIGASAKYRAALFTSTFDCNHLKQAHARIYKFRVLFVRMIRQFLVTFRRGVL